MLMEKIKICEFEVDGSVDAELFLKVKETDDNAELFIPDTCNLCYAENSFEIVDGKWRCKECGSEYSGGFLHDE